MVRTLLTFVATLALAIPFAAAVDDETERSTPPAQPGPTRLQGRSGFFERLPPRPTLTADERAKKAAALRAAYRKASSEWPAPLVDSGVEWRELGLLAKPEHPATNPYSEARAKLGRILFFDPRLSRTGEMACASCHDPDLAWADGRTVSFGLGRTELRRNAPSVLNAAFAGTLFWDGRADSLEDQAVQVLRNEHEMACSEDLVAERIASQKEYVAAFRKAFADETVTLERVAQALACFQRTLVGGRSTFDRFLKGDAEALSDEAILGLDLFRREARCMNCHHGPLLSDGKLHDVGLSYYGRTLEDLGRYTVTKEAEDVGKFRTPTLRNVSRTAPYMHNGIFPLPGVLRMYNAGMPTLTPKEHQQNDPLFPKKSPLLKPLGLNSQDLDDLEAFLQTLEEPRLRMRPPALPGLSEAKAPAEDES